MNPSIPRFDEFVALGQTEIDSEGRQWIEVMPTADEAKNGPWLFTITPDDLEVFAQSIRDNPGRIPIDYDHDGAADRGGSTRAAGWFTGEAKVEDGKLLAQVQWTPRALEEVSGGEFKFISPEFTFQNKNPKTGLMTKAKQIMAATLTNRPFFRDLAPVASELLESEALDKVREIDPWLADVVMEALRGDGDALVVRAKTFSQEERDRLAKSGAAMPDGSFPIENESDLHNAIQSIGRAKDPAAAKRHITKRARSLGLTNLLPDDWGAAASDHEGEEEVTDYLKALGLDESADVSDKVKAVLAKLQDENIEMRAKVADLEANASKISDRDQRIEELEKRDRARDIEVILDKAVVQGRVLPAEKDTLAEVFADDVNGLRKIVATRPQGMYLKAGKEYGSGGRGPTFEDPDTTALAERMNITGDVPVDDQSAGLHVRAEQWLKEQGKTNPTEADWLEAYTAADRVAA